MIKIMRYLQPDVFILLFMVILTGLSCERQDLSKLAEQEVTDIISPIPGDNGNIAASDITSGGFALTWSKASDDITAQGDLEYSVYYSASNNISTTENAQANGTAVSGWTADITTISITDLSEITYYFFNVLVRDEAGKISAYAMNYTRTADWTPPAVNITYPADSGTISASITVTAEASDNDRVSRVEFFINGATGIGIDTEAPYESGALDTSVLTNGGLKIRAVAYDHSGNSAYNEITVTVSN